MNDIAKTSPRAATTVPPDDPTRKLSIVNPDDPALRHVSVVGDTYTILLSGAETAGRYCLIDMNVPHCGGPGPHRHDFEEMFTLLEGEIEFTFRGEKRTVTAGMTVNIPANAPHFFTNSSAQALAHALHVLAGRPGGLLPGHRQRRREPNEVGCQAERRGDGDLLEASDGGRPEVSHRTAQALAA
jgi:mannose-6-phosphate isomerase-like protein (cupin superfamily)